MAPEGLGRIRFVGASKVYRGGIAASRVWISTSAPERTHPQALRMKEVSMRPWQTAAVAVLVFLLAFSALLILSPSSEGQERTLRFALTRAR